MSKKEFWIRLPIYALFLFVIPAVFLIIRFNLFQKISALNIGGWGIVAILVVGLGFIKMMKEVKKGLPFCYLNQVITGLYKVIIPLLLLTFIIYFSKDSIKHILQFLVVLIPSEFVAILVNPIPRWAYENKLEEDGYKLKQILKSAGLSKHEENKNQ